MSEQKVIAITGASNGMGLEAAKLFARRGWIVYGGARRVEKIPTDHGIHAERLDVTEADSRKLFIQTILRDQHRIDVLINNAGYGEYGPLEEISLENIQAQFDVNFFGAVALAQLVLPTMRSQHSGRIVNISSIGEDVFTPLGGAYHATKAALRRWSNVLDQEVKSFGIRSVIVQPGATQSSWSEIAMTNAKKNLKPDSAYRKLVEAVQAQLAGLSASTATSADLAKLFYRAATDPNPKYAYFNSWSDRLMARTARVHPRLYIAIVDRLMKRFAKNAPAH